VTLPGLVLVTGVCVLAGYVVFVEGCDVVFVVPVSFDFEEGVVEVAFSNMLSIGLLPSLQ